MRKTALSLALTLALCLSLAVPAFAVETKTVYLAGFYPDPSDMTVGTRATDNPDAGTLWLESSELEQIEVAYPHEYESEVSYPVYSAAAPVTVTLNGGETEETTLEFAAGNPDDLWEGEFISSLQVNSVSYDAESGAISTIKENAAFFDGSVYTLPDGTKYTIEDYLTNHEIDVMDLSSFVKGAELTLSQPGSYYIGTGYAYTAGACAVLIVISDQAETTPEETEETTTPEETTPEETAPAVEVEDIPAEGTAYASTQTVTIDGEAVEFEMYALKNADGNDTNYIKLRDLAYVLNETDARFSVGWDEDTSTISVTSGEDYGADGTEMTTPFEGDRAYTGGGQTVIVNGAGVELTAIVLNDDDGGGYTYFKLRDLGAVLGFDVGWTVEDGVTVATN